MRKTLGFLLLTILLMPSMAVAAPSIDQLFKDLVYLGYNERTAHRLYGRWNDVRPYLARLAKSGSEEHVQLAAKLVQGRLRAIDEVAFDTIGQMAEKGYYRPISGRFASGSLPPLPKTDLSLRNYIVKAAAKDIDATYVGRNLGVAEDYVERLAINWTARTTGRAPLLPNKTIDYAKVNQVLKASEFTPFPHSTQGAMSSSFRRKFPQIVHESYTGPAGQRMIELKYGHRATADIFRYGDDNLPKSVIRNQPVANIIAHEQFARFTDYQRMKLMDQQYMKKFLGHLEGNIHKRAQTSSKMLAEMLENDARIMGKSVQNNALYRKAQAVKEALKNNDKAALRRLTQSDDVTQGLANFNVDADDNMAALVKRNRVRMAEFTDETLGRPAMQSNRLATLAKAAQLIGYGLAGADAYLRAKEGEKAKEVTKALTTVLAADVAGTAVGSLATTTGGAFLSGVGTAAVAAVVVKGGLDYSEEGITNLMSGYKTDATLEKIFLTPGTVGRFRNMSAEEIRRIIDMEWDEQHQWGGLFVGKGTDDARREAALKHEIYQKAIDTQRTMNANALRTQIVGALVREQLEELVDKHDKKKLNAADYKRLSGILTGGDTGEITLSKAWREIFGEGFQDLIEKRFSEKYQSLKNVLDGMNDLEFGLLNPRKPSEFARKKADNRYAELRGDKEEIEKVFGDYDRHFQALRNAVGSGVSEKELAELYRQLENDYKDLLAEYDSFASGIAVTVDDINKSYGHDSDEARGHEMKSVLARMLQGIDGRMRLIKAQQSNLRKFNDLLGKADRDVDKRGAPIRSQQCL